jgi:DNA repair protein RadC
MHTSLPEDVVAGPRERILQLGEPRLSDAECLALILRTGLPGEAAEALAQRLLRQFGGLPALASSSPLQLAAAGIGPVRAAALCAAFGLARRLGEAAFRPGTLLRHGGDVARLVRDAARGARRESFFVVLVDARHRLQSLQLVSLGGVDAAPVHPRDVLAPAVRDGAAAVIVAHNHPSGDPGPSADDRRVTDRLRQAGELMGIQLLDHIIVGGDRFYSFAEEGYFPYG